jgi:Chaperone of endosialidase
MTIANTTIQLKKSLISGNTPSTLASGELAINAADDKIFYSKPGGSISYITNQQSFATVNANSSLVLASSSTDTLNIIPGTDIAISACTATKSITISSTASSGGLTVDQLARNTANSKVYNFRQNTSPTSANNVGDLWTNIDTGVVYENFGNTSNPVWAETGPTGVMNNTAPGIFTALSITSANGLYSQGNYTGSYSDGVVVDYVNGNGRISVGPADGITFYNGGVGSNTLLNISSTGQLYSNYTGANGGAALMLSGTGTQGGANYFDFLRANNTVNSSSAMSFRLDNTGTLQLINSAYTTQAFAVTQTGVLFVGSGSASSTNNDATTNYINFNNQNSVIYDDGNFHIHSRGSGQSMWINTNGGDLRLLQQSPVNGGANGTSVIIGGAQGASASGFLNVLSSRIMNYSGYGYLSSGGAGTVGGSSGNVGVGIYCPNRIYSGEVDSTSDERLKDIKGVIPEDIALKFVKNINGIHYTWKDGFGDDGLKSGFGAQSVHKAGFAHMVSGIPNENVEGKVDDDGWVHPDKEQLNINYSEAIPYHHEVIKNLLNRIEQLEQTIEELKSK